MKSKALAMIALLTLSCSSFIGCNSTADSNVEEANNKIEEALKMADSERINAAKQSMLSEELKKMTEELNSNFKRLFFLTTGENIEITNPENEDVYAKAYRVEIYQDEIYRSLYIREIEYFGEGGNRFTQERKIDLVRVLKISEEETSTLRFKEWVKPNQFLLILNDDIIDVRIMENFNFSISRL